MAKTNKLTIAVVAMTAVVAVSAGAIVYTLNNREDTSDGFTIGYASGAGVFLDEESLQAAMDKAIADSSSVTLRYKNNAYSDDGKTFSCLLANSAYNYYDAFFTICTDNAMTDQVFLSKLVPPGGGFDSITLDRALEPGNHTVFVAITMVETAEDGTQSVKGQAVYTMDFHVSE